MQVSVEEVNATRRKLAVEVPVDAVTAEIDRAFGRVQQQAKLKGFRPGRAPRAILEKYFGDQVRADVLSHLIEHSYSDAVKQAGLRTVGPPEIVPENVEAGKPLRYSATVDILPKLEVKDFQGLPAKRPRRAVTDGDVEHAIERLRESLAELRPVEGRETAQTGDFVSIDYEASVDGTPLSDAKRENRLVEVGKGMVPPEIDRELAGMKIGEAKSIQVEFAEDYADPKVAGRSVRFDVTLRGIREKVRPPADDELAKEHGETTTLQDLRAKLRERISQSFQREAEEQVREQLIDELVRRNTFDVPGSLVERQVESFIEDLLSRMGENRSRLENDAAQLTKLREEYRPRAERQVRAVLALDAIAEQNGTEIPEEKIEQRVSEMATRAGEQAARLRELYRDPEVRGELRSRLAREQALDAIVAAARIEEVDVAESVVAPTSEKG